jgi:molybdopterin-guanine dinucleotide biosynthesis protein A
MDQFEAFILAGGASSRMGVDKSQLLIGAESLTQHIASILFNVTPWATLVGHTAEDTRLKTVMDIYPHWGALGGLHGALHECKSEWAFVVACDLPLITSELISRLANKRNDNEAIVPIQQDGRPQPLCAFYRVNPCLERATELIGKGFRRPLDLLENVKTRWVAFSELEELPESQNFFVNINTPEDYYEAIQKSAVHKNLSGY